jgi:hypothetical protein
VIDAVIAPPLDVPVHVAVVGWKASAGHVLDVPVQWPGSHGPDEARRCRRALEGTTQKLLLPSNDRLRRTRRRVDVPCTRWARLEAIRRANTVPDVPLQLATSQAPADARQMVATG